MLEQRVYEIISVTPQTYLVGNVPVTGYLVRAKWTKYEETIELNVPNMDKDMINTKLMELYRQRSALDQLGLIKD